MLAYPAARCGEWLAGGFIYAPRPLYNRKYRPTQAGIEALRCWTEAHSQFLLYFTRHLCDKASEFTNKTMRNEMEKMKCPHCGSALTGGVALCGECGREITGQETGTHKQEKKRRGLNNIYAILTLLLIMVGGSVLLMMAGLLPNPTKSVATVAIVNGEKITAAEVDKKIDLYKRNQAARMDFSSPEGKKAIDNIRKEIVKILIQERILVTEAVKEKIAVTPEEVAERIAAIKRGLNLSDKDFENFAKNNGMSLVDYEKRIEREYLIKKLIAKGTEKGLKKEAWVKMLIGRATVEVFE
jgi:hypothetical protein